MKSPLPTDPERWRRIEDLLDAAFERPGGERRAFLAEACAEDPELCAHLEDLLTAGEEAGDFLDRPVKEAAAALLADTSGGAPPPTDRVLGPYRLIREIGAGGMGVVYEAEDARLRRRVAIKLLPPEYSRDPAAKERFLREARAASGLDDPNICTVHDIGDCDGQLYIVMAYYEGETLKERLARGPLPVAEARQVAVEVARALARAHEAGIVHRDIKPANVMLTRRGKVKVLDFGIAKIAGDTSLTRTGSSPGTPAYMSPEQARGEPVDGRSDIWALGALLYEMLTGRRPFPGEDERAVLSAVQNREPEPLVLLRPEAPLELAQIVAKALAKDPARRYADAADLLTDLGAPKSRVIADLPGKQGWIFKAAFLVACILLALYLSRSFWLGSPDGRVRPEDYAAYIELERRAEGGERLGHEELEQLDALLRTSPDLLGAHRLAADVARGLREIDRALGYASEAERIAPNDPRLLFSRFRAEMAGKRFNAAETTLKRLSILVPDDAHVPRAQADLLETRGELKKALLLRQEAVRRRPSWPQIVELATLEFRLGSRDNARSRLAKLLEEQPANQYVRETLALWELGDGDLERAASLYEELIRRQPEPVRRYFTNLAFIRYLLGDYAAAETANRRALALDPENTLTRFNIATQLEAQGKLSEALPLYRTLAEELAATPDLDDRTRMLYAQCLARLGWKDAASRLAEQVLERLPQDFQIFHQAAQIYTILGERLSALHYIERALKKGVRREWFTIPEFDSLKEDPDFQTLLKTHSQPRPRIK